jgi:hypothetical protein
LLLKVLLLHFDNKLQGWLHRVLQVWLLYLLL